MVAVAYDAEQFEKDEAEARATIAQAARDNPAVFNQFVLKDEETGDGIELAPMHRAWHQLLNKHPNLVIWAHVESGKAIPVDTPIPTPSGWTTMGRLKVGDAVFGSDGSPCRVTFATEVQHGRRVFEVRFDDGDVVLADADHQWIAASMDDRRPKPPPSDAHVGNGEPCACGCGLQAKVGKRYVHNHHSRISRDGWRVVTTADMLAAGVTQKSGARRPDGEHYGQSRWRIPLCDPVQYPERELPIPPYVLGAWLGDGESNGTILTFHEKDRFVFERCRELVGAYEPMADKRNPSVFRVSLGPGERGRKAGCKGDPTGLRWKLRTLGLLGNKHIPQVYLTASIEQRRELLAGLLDTDGYVSRKAGRASQIELSSSKLKLAEDVLELARSLGFKARLKSARSTLYGRDVGMRHRVFFTAREPVFHLPRKLEAQNIGWISNRARYRYVIGIREVDSIPVRCISVDSADSSYLMDRSYTVTHNTQQVSIGRVLWEIGRNPNIRVLVLSNTKDQAGKIVEALKRYIEQSDELHEVFPDMRTGDIWQSRRFTIGNRTSFAKDATVQAAGVFGNILGSRVDLLILDDILDVENTYTHAAREKVWRWIQAEALNRLTRNARVAVVGTAFHPEDALHRFAKLEAFEAVHYPIIDPATQQPRWPERWSLERIALVAGKLGPIESARALYCVARDDSTARFKEAWIDTCIALGNGKDLCYALNNVPNGYRIITGVDLAVQQKDANDETALFTIAVHPDGAREVINIEGGRFSGPEIVDKLFDHHRRYQSILIVENNAAQDFILQFASHRGALPMRAFTTGRNKAHPEFGIESIAAEMAQGKWIIPNRDGVLHPEVDKWRNDMLYYDPRAHTGDRLMACLAPGAKITTARGLVPIEDVREGDEVLTHRGRFRLVTGTSRRAYEGEMVELKPAGLPPLLVTPEHPVWVAGARFERADRSNRLIPAEWGWRDSRGFRAGDFVLIVAEGAAMRIASAETIEGYSGPIYNLHVDEDESFVANGIAVHNSWFAREGVRMGEIVAETGTLSLRRR